MQVVSPFRQIPRVIIALKQEGKLAITEICVNTHFFYNASKNLKFEPQPYLTDA